MCIILKNIDCHSDIEFKMLTEYVATKHHIKGPMLPAITPEVTHLQVIHVVSDEHLLNEHMWKKSVTCMIFFNKKESNCCYFCGLIPFSC